MILLYNSIIPSQSKGENMDSIKAAAINQLVNESRKANESINAEEAFRLENDNKVIRLIHVREDTFELQLLEDDVVIDSETYDCPNHPGIATKILEYVNRYEVNGD